MHSMGLKYYFLLDQHKNSNRTANNDDNINEHDDVNKSVFVLFQLFSIKDILFFLF